MHPDDEAGIQRVEREVARLKSESAETERRCAEMTRQRTTLLAQSATLSGRLACLTELEDLLEIIELLGRKQGIDFLEERLHAELRILERQRLSFIAEIEKANDRLFRRLTDAMN